MGITDRGNVEEEVKDLFVAYVEALRAQVTGDDPGAKVLDVVRQFLKDNSITAPAVGDQAHGQVYELGKLSYEDPEAQDLQQGEVG